MRNTVAAFGLVLALAGCAWPPPDPVQPITGGLDQGPAWDLAERRAFYVEDQGSQVIPAAWLMALKGADGQPFLADKLARYGYLPNESNPTSLLPVGFTLATRDNEPPMVGMTCAACHTREIVVRGKPYRVDGGPAFADFQHFLDDLAAATGRVATDPAAFAAFAAAVLPAGSGEADQAALRADFTRWYRRYAAIVGTSLPRDRPWGPARLDAVAMIFNRLTGLDLGPAPDYILAGNIRRADAPVRYPFLWNAPRQDQTQWPGFAPNGNDLFALSRNLGEVYGVFGTFHPVRDPKVPILKVNYVADNSANFMGLFNNENLIKRIGPPAYPFAVDPALAAAGAKIFAWDTAQGGCVACHGVKASPVTYPGQDTWVTPITPIDEVQTDTRELYLLTRTAEAGALAGAPSPLGGTIGRSEKAITLLTASVVGSILQAPFQKDLQQVGRLQPVPPRDPRAEAPATTKDRAAALTAAIEPAPTGPAAGGYEARVLRGIWATAPYLHNGSVPTLADLLEPPAQRPAAFAVGPNYDPDRLGLARDQAAGTFVLATTDCSDRNSGNSRCGHSYGTALTVPQKQALLEYLKRL